MGEPDRLHRAPVPHSDARRSSRVHPAGEKDGRQEEEVVRSGLHILEWKSGGQTPRH